MAQYLSATDSGLEQAGHVLRNGGLVAFPTETVYGLGANAMDEKAVLSIFTTKGRPLTDPLIVHVSTIEQANDLLQLTDKGKMIFNQLATRFFPGPLTLIARANASLPSAITAGTGFVGVRIPAHPIARKLLEKTQIPVAAPSANRFGHISPTSAEHVMSDLGTFPIYILKTTTPSQQQQQHEKQHDMSDQVVSAQVVSDQVEEVIGIMEEEKACQIGIESTVAKIDEDANELVIFRKGGVSEIALQQFIKEKLNFLSIRVIEKTTSENAKESQQAPGQLLKHYAPDVVTYLVTVVPTLDDQHNPTSSKEVPCSIIDNAVSPPLSLSQLSETVIVDFCGSLSTLAPFSLQHLDLSVKGDINEALTNLFQTLRQAETIPGVQRVILADLSNIQHEHAPALYDRMFRAASGKKIQVILSSVTSVTSVTSL